jgi:hypothetical protein
MHARRFSSVKHKTQGFDGDESSVGRCKVMSIVDDVGFFVCCSAVAAAAAVLDSFDEVDMSTSVVLEESVKDDEQAACSRA